jgi:threonine dehydrogenase-like Zn-dependent dehydrogenase
MSEMLFSVNRAGVKAAETVVIQGAGGLGLYGTAVSKVRGARVIVIDSVPLRLEQARQFGADEVVDLREYPTFADRQAKVLSLTGGIGADAVIDVTGVASSFEDGWQLLRPGGRMAEIGTISPGKKTEVDVGLLTRRGVQIVACLRFNPWYLRLALEFLERHQDRYPFDRLIDAVYPLEQAEQALRDSAARKITRASLIVEGR